MTNNTTPSQPVFSCGSDHPADLLVAAATVVSFLCDTAECLRSDGPGAGLSEDGAFGLQHILGVVQNTITEALARI